MKKSTQILEKVFDILGEILALLTIMLHASFKSSVIV